MKPAIKKSLLLTLRDKVSCSQGVQFVGSFFQNPSALMTTFFYVLPQTISKQKISEMWGEDRSSIEALPPEIVEVFSLCGNVLKDKGFLASQIRKIARKKQTGTIQDIIREGKDGLYDAIVFGKKGSNFLEDILYGNLGHEVLEKELAAPVWFCRDPDATRKNVLICLDGSPLGERVADHVGYILHGETHHSVTLLHIDKGQGVNQEKAFHDAIVMLKSYGLTDERIHTSTVKALRVTNTLLESAEQGKFAAIAIGSVGRTASMGICQRIVGAKCKNIFNEIEKTALWIVP